jgi:hypothetical protein
MGSKTVFPEDVVICEQKNEQKIGAKKLNFGPIFNRFYR